MNYSQQQLADRLNVSRSAVAKWERDKGIPDIDNLKALAAEFHISMDTLLDNPHPDTSHHHEMPDNPHPRDQVINEYLGTFCSVDVRDWNDGIHGALLVHQDDTFLYYIRPSKKQQIAGALA